MLVTGLGSSRLRESLHHRYKCAWCCPEARPLAAAQCPGKASRVALSCTSQAGTIYLFHDKEAPYFAWAVNLGVHCYPRGAPFTLCTDYHSLTFLKRTSFPNDNAPMFTRSDSLQGYEVETQ